MSTIMEKLEVIVKEAENLKSLIYVSSCCGKNFYNGMCMDCGEHCGEVTESKYYD